MKALILDVESQETYADSPPLHSTGVPSPAPASPGSLDPGQGCFKPPGPNAGNDSCLLGMRPQGLKALPGTKD